MSGSIATNPLSPGAAFQVNNALVPQPSLIDQFGAAANAASATLRTRQNSLVLQGAQAQAQAYKDNTDANGNTNFPAMLGELGQIPGGAYALPEASAAVLARQKSQLDLNQAQLAQTENRTNVFNSALTPLIRKGAGVTAQDVYSTIAGLKASGFPTDEFIKDASATMPTMDPSQTGNPQAQAQAAYGQQLQSWIYDHAGRSWGPAVGVSTSTPHFVQQDTGGGVRMVDTNPFTNPGIATGDADTSKTFTPVEASSQATITGADGSTYSVPRATLAGMQGQGGLVAPGAAGGIFGSGRYGGSAAGGPAAGGAPPAAGGAAGMSGAPAGGPAGGSVAPGMPAGAIRTGLGPASTSALATTGKAAADEGNALFSSAQGVPDRKAMLSDMGVDLANAPTGPGTQTQAYWSAFANRHIGSLAQLVPGIQSPTQVASFENFEKVAGRYMQSQASQLGPVTNDKLSSAATSNPNAMFSTLGNQGVIHMLQGNEDAIAAKNTAWQSYLSGGGDPSKYQAWSTNFNNSGFSPSAFWMKNMNQDERTLYVNSLSPQDQQSLFQGVRTAIGKGWMSPSDFAPPSPSSGAPAPAAPATSVTPVVPTN